MADIRGRVSNLRSVNEIKAKYSSPPLELPLLPEPFYASKAARAARMSNEQNGEIDQGAVEAAFAGLSHEHKQLLLWHRVDQLTHDDTAVRRDILREANPKMAALIGTRCRD